MNPPTRSRPTTSAVRACVWPPTFLSSCTARTARAARSWSSTRPTAPHWPPASCAADSSRTTSPELPTEGGETVNRIRTATTITTLGLLVGMMAGCAGAAAEPASQPSDAGGSDAAPSIGELHLGYFANVTHAPALVGLEEGLFADALPGVDITTQVFNAGPAAIEALTAGAIDATYIGPNPSINTFIQSGGESARVIAGATTGGAALVVRDGIDDASDLEGKTLASPQLGNTQDVALRVWLADEGYKTDTSGGGDVHITPTENAQTLTLFQQGG